MKEARQHTASLLFRRFALVELLSIALLASLGIATKPLVMPIVRLAARPLLLPGGAVASGYYMMWLVLSAAVVRKAGAATLAALVQALLVIVTGTLGSHGPVSLITYVGPGIAADIAMAAIPLPHSRLLTCLLGGAAASACGVFLTNLVFYRLAPLPLTIAMGGAAISGSVGGVWAWAIARRIVRSVPSLSPSQPGGPHADPVSCRD